MSRQDVRGRVYRCSVCGSELAVLCDRMGEFAPRCCDRGMIPIARRVTFYVCPVCGAEIAVLKRGAGEFVPRCCDRAMAARAA